MAQIIASSYAVLCLRVVSLKTPARPLKNMRVTILVTMASEMFF